MALLGVAAGAGATASEATWAAALLDLHRARAGEVNHLAQRRRAYSAAAVPSRMARR